MDAISFCVTVYSVLTTDLTQHPHCSVAKHPPYLGHGGQISIQFISPGVFTSEGTGISSASTVGAGEGSPLLHRDAG